MRCVSCGKLAGSGNFCKHCGDEVGKYYYRRNTEVSEDKINKLKIVVIITVALFLKTTIVVVGARLGNYYKEFNSNYNETENTPKDNRVDSNNELDGKEKINSP